MLIDTHCHLNFKQFNRDRNTVITNAKKAGVKKFINPGVDYYSSKRAIELAHKFKNTVWAGIGFHPYEAQKNPNFQALKELIHSQFTVNKSQNIIVAIGECGLDYHQYKGYEAESRKDNQKKLLEKHLLLAGKYNLPVIIHTREAFGDLFDVIDSQPTLPRGVLHCFSGGMQEVRFAKKRKLYIGIDGNITYSKLLQTIIPQIPLSMILLETDSPYLTPIPHRGKKNQPKYLTLTAKKIAELKSVSVTQVAKVTTSNALELFNKMN